MLAIRGATTITADEPQQIREAVAQLLREIAEKNRLCAEEMLFILFSNTADIRSLYPAKAAREAGFVSPALFSAAEPDIAGALPLCIRVLVLAEKEGKAAHVYLRGAASLRKDLKQFAVALDGPSGSGKSTVAKLLAEKFDILYLDTGAMYRACALYAARAGLSEFTEEAVRPLLASLPLRVEYIDGAQHTMLGEEDVSEAIRRPEVSMAASRISALRCVREKMVEMQRKIASERSCVLDGRDIGSFVLPNAQFKFYVTASSKVRAERRCEELRAKGFAVELGAIQKEIEERDANDMNREFSPLVRAEDAVLVDTSDLTIGEVVDTICKKIQEKV